MNESHVEIAIEGQWLVLYCYDCGVELDRYDLGASETMLLSDITGDIGAFEHDCGDESDDARAEADNEVDSQEYAG